MYINKMMIFQLMLANNTNQWNLGGWERYREQVLLLPGHRDQGAVK
jgi:hypothetical protein